LLLTHCWQQVVAKNLINIKAMKRITFLFSFILSTLVVDAQQTTNGSGGTGTIENFIVDWNFGELTLIDAPTVGNLLISQGLLQPNRGLFTEPDNLISTGELKILPNPTNGILTVWTGFLVPGKLQFEFFDAKGSRIIAEEKTYTSFNTYQFELMRFAAAAYPLKVTWIPTLGKTRKANFVIIKQ
jgi:hypothetical protein